MLNHFLGEERSVRLKAIVQERGIWTTTPRHLLFLVPLLCVKFYTLENHGGKGDGGKVSGLARAMLSHTIPARMEASEEDGTSPNPSGLTYFFAHFLPPSLLHLTPSYEVAYLVETAKVVVAWRGLHHPAERAALIVQEVQRHFIILFLQLGQRERVHVGGALLATQSEGQRAPPKLGMKGGIDMEDKKLRRFKGTSRQENATLE